MEQIITYLLDKGVGSGVIIVLLLFACKKLYEDKEASQEKRIIEGQRGIEAIEKSTAAFNALTELIKAQRGSRRGES